MASISLIPLIREQSFAFCHKKVIQISRPHANACHSELVNTSLLVLVFLPDSCFSACIFHDCIVILTCRNNSLRWGAFATYAALTSNRSQFFSCLTVVFLSTGGFSAESFLFGKIPQGFPTEPILLS